MKKSPPLDEKDHKSVQRITVGIGEKNSVSVILYFLKAIFNIVIGV